MQIDIIEQNFSKNMDEILSKARLRVYGRDAERAYLQISHPSTVRAWRLLYWETEDETK